MYKPTNNWILRENQNKTGRVNKKWFIVILSSNRKNYSLIEEVIYLNRPPVTNIMNT